MYKVYSKGYNHLRLTNITITEVNETRVKGVKEWLMPHKSANFDVKRQTDNRFFLGSGSAKSTYFLIKV